MERRALRENVVCNFNWDKVQKHRNSPYEKLELDQLFELLNKVWGKFKTDATNYFA